MAAFDFPPTPAVGTLYPLVAEVGKPQYRWNGTEWTAATFDPAGYVRKSGDAMTGALSLAGDPTQALHAVPKQYIDAQRQRVSLAGVKQVDVQVPAGAVMARICGMFSHVTSATAGYTVLQLSVAPGVFRNTANDYQLNGIHYGTTSAVWQNSSAVNSIPGMLLTQSYDLLNTTAFFDGLLQLKRKDAGSFFTSDTRSMNFLASSGYFHTFYQNLLHIAASGSSLNVLAIRLITYHTANWDNESYLNIEWF